VYPGANRDCRPSIDELKSHLQSLGADHVLTYDEFLSRENNTRTKIKEWIGRDGKETAEMAKLLSMDGKLGEFACVLPARRSCGLSILKPVNSSQ
jgi:hypothetical protein